MDDQNYILHKTPVLTIPAEDAELLLALGDGDAALLYLLARTPAAPPDEEALCRELSFAPERLRSAAEKLRSAGLLGAKRPLPPPDELPEYSAEDVVRRSRSDPQFRALVGEAQSKLGHLLSGADLKTLFGIYDRLGLSAEVILLLMNYCAEKVRRRYGEGRSPTMHMIEKEAFSWVNREIVTTEQAEEYLAELEKSEAAAEALVRLLQLGGRQPTATERRYMEEWLAMGFPQEAFAIAYDRTVIGTGKLTWKYMDTILRSWHSKGLHTPEEIEKGDTYPAARAPRGNRTPAPRETAWQDDDLAKLENLHGRKEGK